MVPFSRTPLYTGPIATKLDGADISLFIGLPVAAILYWVFSRSIDLPSERRLADAEARELEEAARAHRPPPFGTSPERA
jgi:nucleobase:cation symporter-1, NCS1 family